MNIRSDNRFYLAALFLCLGFVLNLGFAFSVCSNQPSSIMVTSGGSLIGDFGYSSITSGEVIYVRSDLGRYPLKVDFIFNSIDADCFSSNNDIMFKLFPAGISLPAGSISTSGESTVAKFSFNIDVELPESFSSIYVIKNKNNPSGFSGYINFGSDESAPVFSQVAITPSNPVLKPNTTIRVDFVVVDTGSGLSSVSVSNSNYGTTNLDGENIFSDDFSEVLTSSKTYTIRAVDMLGNSVTRDVEFLVDNSAPQISNLDVEEYSKNSNGDRFVSMSVEVSDESFALVNVAPQVYADFSSFSSGKERVSATLCSKVPLFDNKYVCVWSNIVINALNSTSTVTVPVTARDSIGNEFTATLSHEIFYDNEGPDILEFYFENSQGVRNIFNALENESHVFLKFNDESMAQQIRLVADFDGIEFYVSPECEVNPNSGGECVWDLGGKLNKYSGEPMGSLLFSVTLIDIYGNRATESINVSFNNLKPLINKIELIETTDIKDGIVNSGEKINFRVFISDDNLILNGDFIYADFSSVDFREGMGKYAGVCSAYNESLYQCDFNGVVVDNGYMNRTVSFYVIDSAGNVAVGDYVVEVLKIGNESPRGFKIERIPITNVLNRNLIVQSGANGWFEGEIEYLDVSTNSGADINPSEFKIVNYFLKSCNDSDMNPIPIGDRNLYPRDIVRVGEDGDISRDFVLKTEVRTHPNMVDLNNKSMKCTMSILKRDAETLYEPELVDFYITYDFYDLPQDTLLKAQAKKILDMAEDADFLGSWFDSVYSVYNFINSACSLISSANGLIAGVSNVWTFISWVLHGVPMTTPVAYGGDTAIYKTFGVITSIVNGEGSVIKKFCDFVTCRNGGLLGNFWSESAIGEFASSGKGWLDGMSASLICGVDPVPNIGFETSGGGDPQQVDITLEDTANRNTGTVGGDSSTSSGRSSSAPPPSSYSGSSSGGNVPIPNGEFDAAREPWSDCKVVMGNLICD